MNTESEQLLEMFQTMSLKLRLVLDVLDEFISCPQTEQSDGSMNLHVPKEVRERVVNQMRRAMEL